ncbi:hypothetical protein HM1_1620 [Heliomicrobium modesticaldum Ice1]|uniref:Uncharacterized protein n=2 Tax=Heliomicrobium modesticaldum TaxID=35701 RepID=B0TDE9_HELMI|nr:hypothetical protein HM1_1620 [Heliomicrobium modesticaldum Ice1]
MVIEVKKPRLFEVEEYQVTIGDYVHDHLLSSLDDVERFITDYFTKDTRP